MKFATKLIAAVIRDDHFAALEVELLVEIGKTPSDANS